MLLRCCEVKMLFKYVGFLIIHYFNVSMSVGVTLCTESQSIKET